MRKQPNTKMIGLFMLSGLAIFIGIILGYITNNYITNKKDMLVMYFEESIRGLNAGSSVVFNGVQIGKVEKIELIANSNNMSFRIPVYVTLSKGDYDTALLDKSFRSRKELLSKLIEKGLRARLGIQNYITGQLIIELVMAPDTPINLRYQGDDTEILEIPTILSPIKEFSQDMSKLPLRSMLQHLDEVLLVLGKDLPKMLPEITATFKNANNTIKKNENVTNSALNNINNAAINVSKAAASLRNLTDYLERHPEAIVRGKEK